MKSSENAVPTPTRAQVENAVRGILDVATARENLATRLQVAQYAAWRARFDEMKDLHASAGISDAKVFRSADSENTVVVLADIPDFPAAQAWAKDGWRAAIPADGVEGTPAVYFGANPGQDAAGGKAASDASRVSLKCMAHFRVTDYGKWHELFLVMGSSRAAGGWANEKIFRNSEDENDVLLLADIADEDRLRAWLIEDYMTGYPTATGADSGKFRFAVELETR